MERLNGIVKQVISADTYVLIGAKKGGVTQEKQISLACIQCQKLFMKSQNAEKNEEPFAWESREFIRKLIIGKNVSFVIEYTHNNRTYCSVFFEEHNISILLLTKGYATLIQNKNIKSNVYADLECYYKEAKEKKVGIFGNNINNFIRNIIYVYNDKTENKKIYNLYVNKKLKCVVEHIRDGANYSVYAECGQDDKKEIKEKEGASKNQDKINNNKNKNKKKKDKGEGEGENNEELNKQNEKYLTMYYMSFSLCGIIVDMFKKEIVNNVETVKEELYALETKKFVEARLLNRDVEIEIKHIDNNCNLYANLIYKLGNICILLLKNGYAYINEYSIKYVDNPIEYKMSLDEAIRYRYKKWLNYTEKKIDYEKEYFCNVIEVLYGDVVIVDYKNEERRLYLASIKCEKHNKDVNLNTLCILAKDYLKNQIIGERVKIVTNYVKTPQSNSDGYIPQCSDDKGRMHFVSIYKLQKKKSSEEHSSIKIPLHNNWKGLKGDKKKSNKDSNNKNNEINNNDNNNKNKSNKNNQISKSDKDNDANNEANKRKNACENPISLNDDEEYINLNEQLVERGLAKVINHRKDDDKADNYFYLLELEKIAEEKKVGKFDPHIKIIKINNISGNENALRARSFENVLNKYNNLNAYVDYIYGANKFKLYITSQNLLINFILLGITIQKINLKELSNSDTKNKKSNEEYVNGDIKMQKKEKKEYKEIAIQAYKYIRKKLMQRRVQITIVSCDKGGNFIGILKHQNKDLSAHLLSLGYGILNEIGLTSTSERNNYIKAAEEAKKKKKNIWSIEKEEYNYELLKTENDLSAFDNIYYCSYLDDINNICIQLKNKQEELKKLQDELNKSANIESSAITEINKNVLVLAKYIDNLYYRAIILQVNKNKKKALVKYIDFGNEEELDFNDIKKLNEKFNLKNIPSFSIKVLLSGLKIPNDNKSDLIDCIKKFLLDKFLYIKFEKRESNLFHVVFYDYEQFSTNKNIKSVNEEIIFNGMAYVDNSSDTKIFEKLKKEEILAKKNKLFIWSYGDIDYDEN